MDTATFTDGIRVARPVVSQVWYPARQGSDSPRAHYVEQRLLAAMIKESYQDVPKGDMEAWKQVELPARTDALPADPPRARGWPAIVLSHGFGMSRVSYTALAQELASRGYVVLAIDHPYGGFMLAPDGRVLQPGGDSLRRRLGSPSEPASADSALAWDVRRWAAEARMMVRRLVASKTGGRPLSSLRIDTSRVGMLGHSLGGAAALQACLDDALFRACADMDGLPAGDVERRGVRKPVLVLLSQPARSNAPPRDSAERAHREQFARMGHEIDSTFHAIAERNAPSPSYIVKMEGTGHLSFSDAPFLMPSLLQATGSTRSVAETYALIRSYVNVFFDHHLSGARLKLLRPGSVRVPLGKANP